MSNWIIETKIVKYWKENSKKEEKKKLENEKERKKILMKSTLSQKFVKFVNLKKNKIMWNLISKKVNYEETFQFEKLKISNDEFDFEHCENEYLSLKKTKN